MWEGAEDTTFVPPLQPDTATCIDHLTIWDPRQLSTQIGDTTILSTSFFDHKGVPGIIHIPVLTEEVIAPPPPRAPRVPTLLFPVPEQAMETWRFKVAVESAATTIALSSAMAQSMLDCMSRAIAHPNLCAEDGHSHKKDVVLCYLDFKGAFPSTDHVQLVRVLDFRAFPKTSPAWFQTCTVRRARNSSHRMATTPPW
jgi:hypothetical protein